MDLRAAATELYGVAPADFVATRTRLTRQARSEGDRTLAGAIGALPKPTLAASAVNLLVRARPDDVEQLLALGARLRAAQASGSPDVRELSRTSHDRLGALRREAEVIARQAGQALSEPMAQRVQATLHAGMADPWAAQAVRSGLLVGDLASTGLGPVDVSGAVAVGEVERPAEDVAVEVEAAAPPAPPRRAVPRTRSDVPSTAVDGESARRLEAEETRRDAEEARRREAEQAWGRAVALAAEAEAAVDAARDRLEAADDALSGLERDAARREAEIDTLTARLRELRDARLAAVGHERRARATRDDAARALEAARQAADRARAAVPDPPP